MNQKRNYSLDVFKVLLAYVIAYHHLGVQLPPSPAVAVDIFFMMSGFFLARQFYHSQSRPDAMGYTIGHLKTIYPYFLFAIAVAALYELVRDAVYLPTASGSEIKEMIGYFYDQIPSLLMLHSSYMPDTGPLYPTWQLSATLICGYFLFELLSRDERLTSRIIAPASVLMMLSLMYSGADYFDNYSFFFLPLLRGFAGMSLGITVWPLLNSQYWQSFAKHPTVLNLGSIAAIAGLLLFRDRGNIHLLLSAFVLLVCCGTDCWINRLLNRPIFRSCGKYSLALYVNHTLVIRLFQTQLETRFSFTQPQLCVAFGIAVSLYSAFTVVLLERLLPRLKKRT